MHSIRLYHGTSLKIARRIWDEGFQAFSPAEAVDELEQRFGVPAGTGRDWFYDYALARAKRHEASLTDTWRLAASYARNGPEVEWMALCAIGRYLNDGDEAAALRWAEEAQTHAPTVITIEFSDDELQRRFGNEGLASLVAGPGVISPVYAGDEIVTHLPIPASAVVRIDAVARQCVCPPTRDWSAPCALCCTTLMER